MTKVSGLGRISLANGAEEIIGLNTNFTAMRAGNKLVVMGGAYFIITEDPASDFVAKINMRWPGKTFTYQNYQVEI